MDHDSVSVHKHAKKELGQYPAILTSRLVNNPYLHNVTLATDGEHDSRVQYICNMPHITHHMQNAIATCSMQYTMYTDWLRFQLTWSTLYFEIPHEFN